MTEIVSGLPWRADDDDDVVDVNGELVAAVYSSDVDEQAERARLIALSPKLISVLAKYLMLGAGKCTIGKPLADEALSVINEVMGVK